MRNLNEHLPTRQNNNSDDEVDLMLLHEDQILPSSGFTVSVMDAVRREAAAPPAIPFPWKRALPGLLAGAFALALVLAAVVVAMMRTGISSRVVPGIMPPSFPAASSLTENLRSATLWTATALIATFATIKLSLRLVNSR